MRRLGWLLLALAAAAPPWTAEADGRSGWEPGGSAACRARAKAQLERVSEKLSERCRDQGGRPSLGLVVEFLQEGDGCLATRDVGCGSDLRAERPRIPSST